MPCRVGLQESGLEDIDRVLERIEDCSGSQHPGPPPLSAKKHVLYVEHRYCPAPPGCHHRLCGEEARLGGRKCTVFYLKST